MKRRSYKKNKIVNKRLSKINGGRPPAENNNCNIVATLQHRSVRCVVFHPSLPIVVTGSFDGSLKFWRLNDDFSDAICVTMLQVGDSSVKCVAFHQTLPILVTSSDETKLWRLTSDGSSAECVSTLDGMIGVLCVAFHPLQPYLATGDVMCIAKLWRLTSDGSSAECIDTLRGHDHHVNSVAFHPILPILATGSRDRTTMLWVFSDRRFSAKSIDKLYGHRCYFCCISSFFTVSCYW